MNYSSAVSLAIMQGKFIRRKGMDISSFVFHQGECSFDKETFGVLSMSTQKMNNNIVDYAEKILSNPNMQIKFSDYLCICNKNIISVFHPTESDLNAEWEVVEAEVTHPTICNIKIAPEKTQ